MAVLCFISEIFVFTLWAFWIIKIMDRAALGAGLFRSFIVERFVFRKEKFEFSALGANKNVYLESSGNEIKQIIYYRSDIGKFYAFIR